MAKHGADGIPLTGKVKEYATELWLEGPTAFWLNPDGPLSDLTPAEYLEREAAKVHPLQNVADQINRSAYAQGLLGSYNHAMALKAYYRQQNTYASPFHPMGNLGSIIGNIL